MTGQPAPPVPLPRASIVVPTLNEAGHIAALIGRLLPAAGDGAAGPVGELIVADGGSTDGTVEIVRRLARADGRIRLIHNPARIQSAGINAAVAVADPASEVILRADAHADYPPHFAERTLETLERTGADSVVVRLVTTGRGGFGDAVAAALNSPAGSGNSAHRVGGASGFVDHGHHAAFRRGVFGELEGYDESFVANEDAELDVRIRASGRRIWFENGIAITYYPRRTPWALARQYWRYGIGRAQTFRKHGERLRLRQMAPPLLVLGLALSLAAGMLVSDWLFAFPLLYLAALAVIGLVFAWRARTATLLMVPLALAIVHLNWGAGFLTELVRSWRRSPPRGAEGGG